MNNLKLFEEFAESMYEAATPVYDESEVTKISMRSQKWSSNIRRLFLN